MILRAIGDALDGDETGSEGTAIPPGSNPASIQGTIDPRGPILLQLKERSTPRVRSCFS